jgi:glutamate synthase domain-containing protein 3
MMADMNKEFAVHMLNETGKAKAQEIAQAFDACLERLLSICPKTSREMSITRTKLEEAAFFAKKAMAQEPENGDVAHSVAGAIGAPT